MAAPHSTQLSSARRREPAWAVVGSAGNTTIADAGDIESTQLPAQRPEIARPIEPVDHFELKSSRVMWCSCSSGMA
jgi:hypothetical protein